MSYLPPNLARRSLFPRMRGLCPIGPDGNIRHDYFVLFKSMHPANEATWTMEHLYAVFWEVELQQMHEGVFTLRYTLTALLNFHRKMAYWSDPDEVALDADGKEQMLLVFLAEKMLHESLVDALMMVQRNPMSWPDPSGERRRFQDIGENALAYEVAYLDKLDDIMRDNALEGATIALFRPNSPRSLPKVVIISPLRVRLPTWPPRPPAVTRRGDSYPLAEKSVTRPTTRIHMRDQYGDWYPHGEVQFA